MNYFTKVLGLFLLAAGWVLVLATIVLLTHPVRLAIFAACAVAVQILGLAMLFRAHRFPQAGRRRVD